MPNDERRKNDEFLMTNDGRTHSLGRNFTTRLPLLASVVIPYSPPRTPYFSGQWAGRSIGGESGNQQWLAVVPSAD
jgi:hypothetical protein